MDMASAEGAPKELVDLMVAKGFKDRSDVGASRPCASRAGGAPGTHVIRHHAFSFNIAKTSAQATLARRSRSRSISRTWAISLRTGAIWLTAAKSRCFGSCAPVKRGRASCWTSGLNRMFGNCPR